MPQSKPPFTQQIRQAAQSAMRQADLARQLGVSRNLVHSFMHGGGLSFETLDKLADLLGLNVLTDAEVEALRTRPRRRGGLKLMGKDNDA